MGYMKDDGTHYHQQQTAAASSWSELVQTGGHHHTTSSTTASSTRGLIGSTVVASASEHHHHQNSDAKMEDSTTATAPTLVSGGVAHSIEDDDTTTIRSFDSMTGRGLLNITGDLEDDDGVTNHHLAPSSLLGTLNATETCSVSTAPTDEASSLGGFVDWTANPNLQQQSQQQQQQHVRQQLHHHRRVPSWEASPHSQHSAAVVPHASTSSPGTLHLPPSYSPQTGWGGHTQQQPPLQHVASFRSSADYQRLPHPATPPRYRGDPSLPYLPRPNQMDGTRGGTNTANQNYQLRPNHPAGYPYHLQQQQQQPPSQQQQQRRPYPAPSATPPRPSGPRTPAASPRSGPTAGARSSSEVLKTLLRKKACLYESDTSRAVALVTWLVGRSLALAHGFFSRQQLQAGVHACVAPTMDAGWITRTKVNRCMQIILNACFHYIIPRPDGTEESGERMRALFALELQDDADALLASLPAPWNAVKVDPARIIHDANNNSVFETPQSSPKMTSVQAKESPGGGSLDEAASDSKRAVLLCFNENVRSAEDVFRCHNEFIRDTAHACHLQLSSNEWRHFFGREAASTPKVWGNIGIPVPTTAADRETHIDALGMMTSEEVACFRTTLCSKRYDHDHELCGFAHLEVNGGWLRRNIIQHSYEGDMCPHVTTTTIDYGEGPRKLVVNDCPHGIECRLCHSVEELTFHSRHYKKRMCACIQRHSSCPRGEVCPDFHPVESYRFSRKSDGRSPRRGAHHHNHSHHHHHHHHHHATPPMHNKSTTTTNTAPPASAPILYVGPAPMSRFEQHLHMPGLQQLFRQNSAAIHSLVRGGNHHPATTTSTYGVDKDFSKLSKSDGSTVIQPVAGKKK